MRRVEEDERTKKSTQSVKDGVMEGGWREMKWNGKREREERREEMRG